MKKEFWTAIGWIVLVFIFGAALHAGHKTVEYLWPDEPVKMEVIHKTEDGYELTQRKEN